MVNKRVFNNNSLMECVTNSIVRGYIIELMNMIHNIDNKKYLMNAKKQFQNYKTLFEKQTDIETIKDKNKNIDQILDRTSGNMNLILTNTNDFTDILQSSNQIRKYFADNSHKFSFVDIVSIMSEYSGSIKDILININKEIEQKYHKNPKFYKEDYIKTIKIIDRLQTIDNELYGKFRKLNDFNKIYTNNIINAIDNIIKGKCTPDRYIINFKRMATEIHKYFNEPKIVTIKGS